MKTIVYIGGDLPDKDASALRIMANAKALREYGYNVVLVGFNIDNNKHEQKCFEGLESYLLPYPNSFRSWLDDLISIKFYVDIINKQKDVIAVICYNFHAIPLLRLINYGKRNGIKVLADCTEWHTVFHLHGIKKIVKWLDIQARIKLIQFRTDGNIVISKYFESYYEKVKTIVVPPLIDKKADKWKPVDSNDSDAKTIKMVYAGKMGIGKDQLSDCIAALYNLRQRSFRLDIVGISLEEYLAACPDHSRMIEELHDKILFHGRVEHAKAVDFVKRADFSILIREHNRKNDSGFPTKFPESVTCGTPVIATEFSDIKDYIVQYKLGVIVENIGQVETAFLNALSMDRTQIDTLKDSCRKNDCFDYRSYVKPLGDFITDIVGGECHE